MRVYRVALIATLASAIAIVSAVVAAPADAAPGLQIGTEQNGGMDDPARRELLLDTQRALGSNVIRLLLRYDRIATCDARAAGAASSPTNRCYNFATPDAVIRGAQQRGMRVILSIYGVPKWQFNAGENFVGSSDAQFATFVDGYAQFAQAAATRYDGRHGLPRVDQWTIWNEPNGTFFEPRWVDEQLVGPQRYARMYDAAARRIKAVDANLRVAPGPTAPQARALPPLTFMEAALPVLQQLGSPVDAWAHNAYMGGQSPYSSTVAAPFVGLGNLRDLTAVLDRFPITRGKNLWITEFGYQTSGAQKAVSVPEQARLTAEALRFAWYAPRLETFIWYSLHDDEDSGNNLSFQAGLFYAASRMCGQYLCPKPSAGVFLHTLWVGKPGRKGFTTLWGQGRMQPASTRIYVKKPDEGWLAYGSPDTAQTGTVSVKLKLPPGTTVMTCDVRCGPTQTISAGPTAGGGGGVAAQARPTVARQPLVRLGKRASLLRGIGYTVSCTDCRVTARIYARGRASGIARARARRVYIGSSRVTKHATGTKVALQFTPQARRELLRRTSPVVVLRTWITPAGGRTMIVDRPVRLG